MTKESKIKLLILITLLGFICSCIFHYYVGAFKGAPYPLNTFLFKPVDSFTDFTSLYDSPTSSSYFPFANLLIHGFSHIKTYTISFLIFMSLSLISIFYYFMINMSDFKKIDSITYSLIFSLFTFPFLFLFCRANNESLVYISLCLFIFNYKKGKRTLAIIGLSCAIAMKLYPAVFLILLFSYKEYKQIFYTLMLVFILTISSIWILYGGISEYLTLYKQNVNGYQELYVIQNWGLDYGHSLFNCIKESFFLSSKYFIKPYLYIVTILTILISVYVVYIENVFWKRVTILVIMMCLLPYVSADYKLIHFFIPILLFVNDKKDEFLMVDLKSKKITIYDYCFTILFGLLIIPKNYQFFKSLYDGVFIDPIIMLLLLILIVFSSLSERKLLNKINI
jgi:hypothetical protein